MISHLRFSSSLLDAHISIPKISKGNYTFDSLLWKNGGNESRVPFSFALIL